MTLIRKATAAVKEMFLPETRTSTRKDEQISEHLKGIKVQSSTLQAFLLKAESREARNKTSI